uniref:Matrix metallopeptidase 28 n=1 Tax=Gopherus evgoodei TaxID=1825980 RepID=A0A8C4WPJ0_9SAUR
MFQYFQTTSLCWLESEWPNNVIRPILPAEKEESLLAQVVGLVLLGQEDQFCDFCPHSKQHPHSCMFLEKYGYFDEPAPNGPTSEQFAEAVREFQWVTHLPLSGVLDTSTLHQMNLPRCGVSDAESHAAWAERVRALLSGRRAKTRRGKRYVFTRHCCSWHRKIFTGQTC